MLRVTLSALTLLCLSTAALGHEFWIEPQNYQVQKGAPFAAELRNGQKFSGTNLAFFDNRFERFDMIQGETITAVQGRMGDVPALQTTAQDSGMWGQPV